MDQDLELTKEEILAKELTKEYLLKIAPDISIFERYDRYIDSTYTDGLNGRNFNRVIYRITPKINHANVSSQNSFFHIFDSGYATYIIAVCNGVKNNPDSNDYVNLRIQNEILESIDGVGF